VIVPAKTIRKVRFGRTGQEELMELLIGFAILIAIWVVVLWGSSFFGPRDEPH
jgi:hypothetical protein